MGRVLRWGARDMIQPRDLTWGDRDMIQPRDLTREKRKEKIISNVIFLFIRERKDFLPLERELGKT